MQTAGDEVCCVSPLGDELNVADIDAPVEKMTVKEEMNGPEQDDSDTCLDEELNQEDDCLSLSSREQLKPVKAVVKRSNLIPAPFSPAADRGKTRGRRSGWKLKFHHQALPPEYLDHYEASINTSSHRPVELKGNKPKAINKGKLTTNSLPFIKIEPDQLDEANKLKSVDNSFLEKLRLPISAESEVFNRLQDMKMSNDINYHAKRVGGVSDKYLQNKSFLGSSLSLKDARSGNAEDQKMKSILISPAINGNSGNKSTSDVTSQGNKVVNYQDLPFMGEITLDNLKPRRGRKPKKADICHLIYKNYGTIFQGGPITADKEPQSSLRNTTKVKSENVLMSNLRCKAIDSLKTNTPMNHTDVQNRIISSLLEKRLTAASHDHRKTAFGNPATYLPPKNVERPVSTKHATTTHEEPLNLCVKDLNHLKIRLLRKHGNFYEPTTNEAAAKSDYSDTRERDHEENATVHNIDVSNKSNNQSGLIGVLFPNDKPSTPEVAPSNPALPGSYVYWPNAGVFVHPMALQSQLLYYQKMGTIPLEPLSPTVQTRTLPAANGTSSTMVAYPTVSSSSSKESKSVSLNKPLVPKPFSMMMEPGSKTSTMPSELSFPRMKRLAHSSNLPTMGSLAKRKRSAIFIPPMPSVNNANPTTEVSICKFKFTGGAKPSLQEKKMLSVDSGGNFRYYSGTGDKSMRGYEFFPRESLQQTGNTAGSSSEQFLTASAMGSGEKISMQSPTFVDPVTKSQSPEELTEIGDGSSNNFDHQGHNSRHDSEFATMPLSLDAESFGDQDEEMASQFRLRRKRKTRKSLAREKLEQTFKEKGFLIQTQQLESAEGATYCKFRQLRKFTRYLFRSWKDYLPGNVREMSVAAGVGGPQDTEQEEFQMPSPPSPPIVLTLTDEPTTPLHQQDE